MTRWIRRKKWNIYLRGEYNDELWSLDWVSNMESELIG